VFLPLTSGATLCLPNGGNDLESDQVLSWLERTKISILHTTPTLAQSWLVKPPQDIPFHTLRWTFFSGEPLTKTLIHRWREVFTEAVGIINLYGPTETTMVKCFYRIPANIQPGVQPVGWPLP